MRFTGRCSERESYSASAEDDAPPSDCLLCGFHSLNKDVCGCIPVSVKHSMAGGTFPTANIQRQFFDDMPTMEASLRGRKEPVYFVKLAACFAQLILKNADKLCESIVGYLPPPELLHRFDVQVFNTDIRVLERDIYRQLVEPVLPTVLHIPILSRNIHLGTTPICTAFPLAAQSPLHRTKGGGILLKEARRLDATSI